GRQVLSRVLRQERRKQALAPPTDKMSGVRTAHDVHFMDADLFFFADALEHALRPRSFHANLNSGILSFERLAEVFCDRNRHSSVERDHALLPGGLDHGRTQRGRLRRGRRERLGKDGAGRHHRRYLKQVASGKLAISHVRSCLCRTDATAHLTAFTTLGIRRKRRTPYWIQKRIPHPSPHCRVAVLRRGGRRNRLVHTETSWSMAAWPILHDERTFICGRLSRKT